MVKLSLLYKVTCALILSVGVLSTFLGLTNTVTAVKNAQMAESPVLLLGGAAATLLQVCV